MGLFEIKVCIFKKKDDDGHDVTHVSPLDGAWMGDLLLP